MRSIAVTRRSTRCYAILLLFKTPGMGIAFCLWAVNFVTATGSFAPGVVPRQDRMVLAQIVQEMKLERLTPELPEQDVDVSGGYISDLLSDVMANAPRGGVLVTIQAHLNVVAVAVHAELAGVIFAAGRRPEDNVRKKAAEEGIRLYTTGASAFDVAGRLYQMGLRGASSETL